MSYDYEHVLVENDDGILTVTMNRPESLNAVSREMHRGMPSLFQEISYDDDVNAVILTGAGRAFCAGGDVGRMAQGSEDLVGGWIRGQRESKQIVLAILQCEKPVIAKVNGPAVGLGATLALSCDVTFIAESARIGDRHVNVGLVAGDGGSALWPHLVGYARAREFLMSGELIFGPRAAEIGLCNYCVPDAELDRRVLDFARALAAQPPRALQWTKKAINAQLIPQVFANMDTSLALEHLSKATRDHVEAARAFKEKRKPALTGR